MKKSVIAAVVVIALIGLGVAAVPLTETYLASRVKAEIERDDTTKVGAVEIGLFSRRVALVDLKARRVAEINIGRWEASGLAWPLGELLRGRTPLSGFRLGDPLQARRFELTDIRIADPSTEVSWSIGSLKIEDLDLGRYDADIAGPDRFMALVGRIASALSLRHLAETDVIYSAPVTGDTTAVRALTVDDLKHGKFGSIVLTNLDATPREARQPSFTLAEAKASDLDLSRLFSAMSSASWRPGSPVGRIELASASAAGFGGELFSRYGLSLGKITFETHREREGESRSLTRVDGFVLAPPLRSLQTLQLRVIMQSMGLKELKLAFDCAGSENRAKGEVIVERCALEGTDLGEINLTGRFVQLDRRFWQAVDSGDTTALAGSNAALGSARLVLADKSLLDRSLKALAAATGQPAAAARANLAQEIRRYQPAGVLITEDLTKLLDTVARFVEQGGTLTFDAKPDPPLGLDRARALVSPGPDLVEVLGLSVTLSR